MRIAYLFQHANLEAAASQAMQLHAAYIIRGLQSAGHDVAWLSLFDRKHILCTASIDRVQGGDLQSSDLHVCGRAANPFFLWPESACRRMQRELRIPYFSLFDSFRFYQGCLQVGHQFDIFHERFGLFSIGGTLAAHRLRVPLVLEVNADVLNELDSVGQGLKGIQRRWATWTSRFCFQRADAIIAVSHQLKEHLVTHWELPASKIAVLPNAADVVRFRPHSNPASIRSRLGLGNYPIVIFVGNFYPWHAPVELIESFALVHQRIPEAHLYLIGDGQLRSAAAERAEEKGILEATHFVGYVPHTEVPDWLAIADVAVAPYLRLDRDLWFSPLKLFEYMAAGKAVVASATGQVQEVISHEDTGLLVPPGDIQGFAANIVRLLEDDELRRRLGHKARAQAVDRHSWMQYVGQLETIYMQVLNR
jgi:glycosyltransferase involved in cell wall biosynthesis